MKEEKFPKCSQISAEHISQAAELFKVLGDDTRMQIICLLLHKDAIVSDIAEAIDISNSAVSHQLRILRQARLVKYKKEGRSSRYSLDDEHVEDIIAIALEHIIEYDRNHNHDQG